MRLSLIWRSFVVPVSYTHLDVYKRQQQGKVARLLCDIYRSDGTPLEKSPRYILKQVVEMAAKEGYVCEVDPECEFFLFHTDDNGIPTTLTHEKAGYLAVSYTHLGLLCSCRRL